MNAATQKEARERGLPTYFTGKPCVRGHITYRYTKNGVCNQCSTEFSKRWQASNPEEFRRRNENYRRFRKYGLTPEAFEALVEEQNGLCKTCDKELIGRELHIDHCHTTGAVRGLLCRGCNTALGHVKDSVETLERLIVYIKNSLKS